MSLEDLLYSRIGDLMSTDLLTIPSNELVTRAVEKMVAKNVGAVVIVDDNAKTIAGIFSERDLLKKVASGTFDPESTRIGELMTKNPVTVNLNISVAEVFNIFQIGSFRHLPIVDDNDKLAGIISIRDIDKFIYKLVAKELAKNFKPGAE